MMRALGRTFLTWTVALGLSLCLLGLLLAARESTRRAEIASLLPEAAEPEAPITHDAADSAYRDPALAAWMTP